MQQYRPVTVDRARYRPMSILEAFDISVLLQGIVKGTCTAVKSSDRNHARSGHMRNGKTPCSCHVLVHLEVLAADPLIVGFGQGTASEARVDYQYKSQGQGLFEVLDWAAEEKEVSREGLRQQAFVNVKSFGILSGKRC